MMKGVKYFIVGDTQGYIGTYLRNGTYIGRRRMTHESIITIQKSFNHLLYATGSKIGFFNPITL